MALFDLAKKWGFDDLDEFFGAEKTANGLEGKSNDDLKAIWRFLKDWNEDGDSAFEHLKDYFPSDRWTVTTKEYPARGDKTEADANERKPPIRKKPEETCDKNCAKDCKQKEAPKPQGVDKIVLNRDKYTDGQSQSDAFAKFCESNGVEANVPNFLKWLDDAWIPDGTKPTLQCGFNVGNYVFANKDYGLVYEIVKFVTLEGSDKVYAVVRPLGATAGKFFKVPPENLDVAQRRPWTKDECLAAIERGVVAQCVNSAEEVAERLYRLKRGKDGKFYVNGISVNELANNYVDYATKAPCCGFERPEATE